jgi:hypothetical protein
MNDGSPLPMLIPLAITVFMVASMWKVFAKAGRPGWAALVPVYNLVVILEIAGKPLWWFILFLVPIANIVVGFLTYIGLAQRFGKSAGFGVGLALLGFIFFPILAFGDAHYLGSQAGDGARMSGWVKFLIGLVAAVFVILPILAAVAIPAFMRYLQLAQTSEAEQFIKRMSDGARAYYHSPTQPDLTPVPKQFPSESVGPTPPVGTCCANGGTCLADSSLWGHPTWQALNFSIEDPHRYSYQYEVIDGGKGFVARAIGDLDCDGVFSTFEVTGQVAGDGSVQSSASIRRIQERE